MPDTKVSRKTAIIDGNTAASYIAHATNEVICIYPITPSSTMGEDADARSSRGERNLWGTVPDVIEMQSEGGAAGAVHGALTTGALTTTFTSSQGLLLMIPNMFKIAGELTPTVFHVAARAIATQGLSIFGDHSDVMAARSAGWAQLCSNNVQESMDMALLSQAATLESRIPFMHFFDGFRTSHEIQKVEMLTPDDIRTMVDEDLVLAHRARGLNPNKPELRGTAMNPDVFFQARETANPFYDATPEIVRSLMAKFAKLTGRHYDLFEYVGPEDAEQVVILMGSACETMEETLASLDTSTPKTGLVKVRLFRPFDVTALLDALPDSVKRIAVLDRCKEPGSAGEPLYQDVQTTVCEAIADGKMEPANMPLIIGGRYGLGSKEFNPGMAKAVIDNLAAEKPKNHFTIGIHDDLTQSSLEWNSQFRTQAKSHQALFYGLGSDGTVGANKNSIKIIGKATDYYAQGYFVYDSKKSGSMTISHLRFSDDPIQSTYLIDEADFLACHSFQFLERFEMLDHLTQGGVFLLCSPYKAKEVWEHLPRPVQEKLIKKQVEFYVIDAYALAKNIGLGGRINIIMQTAFFKISGVLEESKALAMIEDAIATTYGNKGQQIVDMNIRAARLASERIEAVSLPEQASRTVDFRPPVPANAPEFVQQVTAEMVAMRGDSLPVSKLPADGTYPTGTAQYEKRSIAMDIPVWNEDACIQCNQCAFVCPHATIRMKMYDEEFANGQSPEEWKALKVRGKGMEKMRYSLVVAPDDCTGCGACVHICPAYAKDEDGNKTSRKAINMEPLLPIRERERENWDYFLSLPETSPTNYKPLTMKGSQFSKPLFEFSGACAGCGETPYIKLVTQMFGDRAIIANATGCSSIYGGNLPTTPYTTNADGRGPAWSNSLFEDAAEFGLGMRLTQDKLEQHAREMLTSNVTSTTSALANEVLNSECKLPEEIEQQRNRIAQLRDELQSQPDSTENQQLISLLDQFVPRSVWIFGGDGWAYDIGFGGLDHVLATGRNVNILVLDTGVYSNTGGQSSKATPRAAVAKFAAAGKDQPKKDLGAIAVSYGNVYVAQIAYGSSMPQTCKAIAEAEAYDGPSLIIAYSHCIAHGINMTTATDVQDMAVKSGFWPLYRFNPDLKNEGKTPFQLDSKPPTEDIEKFLYSQNRFKVLRKANPKRAEKLLEQSREDVKSRIGFYHQMAGLKPEV